MKILIVQIGLYGDMVLTTPLFREIHTKYPDAQIHILASRKNYKIIESNPHIQKIWIYEKNLKIVQLMFALRAEKFDVWIDPKDHASSESSLLAKFSNAKIKIGWNNEESNIFTHPTNHLNNPNHHRIETNLAALVPLGITPQSDLLPELFPLKDSEQFVERFLGGIGTPVVVNISAGNESRYLPIETWQKICNGIRLPIVLNYIPNDANFATEIKGNNPNINLFQSRSILDAVSLIKRARILISPDTSVIHIASAFNIPTLGLYSSFEWNYIRFKPLSSQSLAIQSKEGKAVRDIASDEILAAIEQFSL
ncbi:MAG: glycosyltransferase family 9 protein [Ignavibacteriae bacterium]|nr:glycosyltransferase family 9 protein [Ignavibacteriota bacterium]